MKGGRKNMKRAVEDQTLTLQNSQSIMQVLSLRGSNLIEVVDERGDKALAFFPAKFKKSMWIKKGNFVVIDESGRDEAIESGRKVSCVVSQVLVHDQVRVLQKTPQWPDMFKISTPEISGKSVLGKQENGDKTSDEDDDGLPPLIANTNRSKPSEMLQSDSDSDSETDK